MSEANPPQQSNSPLTVGSVTHAPQSEAVYLVESEMIFRQLDLILLVIVASVVFLYFTIRKERA